MELRFKKSSTQFTVFVYGELDECSASNVKIILDKMIFEHGDVKKFIFDLSGLSFMDSTGIGLLIGRYKKLKNLGVQSYISGASATIEKVIELAGLYKIMPKY